MFVFLSSVLLIFSFKLYAESAPVDYEISVVANRTQISDHENANAVSVIKITDEIRNQNSTVLDVLSQQPGVNSNSSGFRGKISSLFMRGTSSSDTLIIIDGVEMNDPMVVGRGFDLSQISLDNIQSIEILKGPQSVMYGPHAIGGVVNIVTKSGNGHLVNSVSLETGSFGYKQLSTSTSWKMGDYSSAMNFIVEDMVGESAASGTGGDNEDDGYNKYKIAFITKKSIFSNSLIDLKLNYSNRVNEVDGSSSPTWVPMDELLSTEKIEGKSFYVGLKNFFDTQKAQLDTNYSYQENRRANENLPDRLSSVYEKNIFYSHVHKINFQGQKNVKKHKYITGISYFEESGELEDFTGNQSMSEKSNSGKGLYSEALLNFKPYYLTLGGRFDEFSLIHESVFTYRLAQKLDLSDVMFVKSSIGYGYKAPTFNQLYDKLSGNTELRSEKNNGFDFSFSHTLKPYNLEYELTYFENNISDLFGSDPTTFKSINLEEVKIRGFELATLWEQGKFSYDLAATYFTFLKNISTNEALLNRPEVSLSQKVSFDYSDSIKAHFDHKYIGSRDNYYGFDKIKNSDVSIFGTGLIYISKVNFIYSFSIKNLFNLSYEEIKGYNSPPLNFNFKIKKLF
jgi:vitamin B12 transporter